MKTNKEYKTIEVTLNNNHTALWEAGKDEWDDYEYDGKYFIIKNGGAWVGLYNLNSIRCIVVR